MPDLTELTPLRPREFFALTWSGEGEWIAAAWLRRLARRPRNFSFTTATTFLTDEVWLVHDTLTWENGRAENRSGLARLIAPDRVSLRYDDMLGGTDLWLRPDGFTFSPYQIMAAMPPLPFPLVIGAEDACEWDATSGELTDTLRLRLFGVPIGRMVMRLRPAPPAG
ncbi:MAG TPA: hypothetical protein VJ741_00190 [Solirubrobacteraceae bacterium]|nr:hypothetical protein [Solirubrobacteraceae bacterium]